MVLSKSHSSSLEGCWLAGVCSGWCLLLMRSGPDLALVSCSFRLTSTSGVEAGRISLTGTPWALNHLEEGQGCSGHCLWAGLTLLYQQDRPAALSRHAAPQCELRLKDPRAVASGFCTLWTFVRYAATCAEGGKCHDSLHEPRQKRIWNCGAIRPERGLCRLIIS